VIRNKSDDTRVNPKIKHRIQQGLWQVLHYQLGGFNFPYTIYNLKTLWNGISVLFGDLFFHETSKQSSIVGTHFGSLGNTTYLLITTIKGKIC
jgi:hypothetical protein